MSEANLIITIMTITIKHSDVKKKKKFKALAGWDPR